jgi:hypothetical protein
MRALFGARTTISLKRMLIIAARFALLHLLACLA